MNRYLQRLWATATLPVKGLVLGLLCGILTWTVLSSFQSRYLEQLLLERTKEHLRDEAASNRMVFHRYLEQHVQLTKLIASYQPLVAWLEQQQRNGQSTELVGYENKRPDWFPPLSAWRGLIEPGGFLIQDTEGNPRAIYRLAADDLPIDSLLQNTLATRRSEGQIYLVALGGQPHLIASSAINNTDAHKLGYLTLISRIDNKFVSKLSYATDAPNVILALFEGDGQHLIASSQPQRLAPDVGLDELRRDYLVTGKPFFDYGSSELRLRLATLIPLDRMAALNERILDSAQQQHLIAAVAFTLTFTLLIYSWSRRIEGVLKHIHAFSEHVLGTSKEFEVRGDALLRLEDDFPRLRDEILAARQSLSDQQRTTQRLKQLELLETVADHLEIGVVLLGSEKEVELQTRQMDRFERTLGEGWYQPLIQQSAQKKELDFKDKLQNQYTFKTNRLSLFAQDDVVLVQNVTEEKRLQRQLRVQETRFRHITESARDAIISIDQSGAVVYWNRSAEEMFQYSATESIGKPITHIMPESYRKAHESEIERIAKGGSAHSVGKILELEGLRKDGAVFPVELSLSAWQMDGNSYYTGILRNITERKQAQQALQESQSRFALFMDRLPAATFIKDAQSRVLYANQ
jgi:PAS domain S-box-containing protein